MKKIFSFQNTYYAADMKTILTSMDENMKELQQCSVLITGANGLIASYLTDVLMWANKQLDYDIDVYALCRNEARAKERFVEHLGHRGFHLIIQDVCEAMSGHKQFDYIIHAACNAHPLAYAQDPVGVMKSNLLGTMHLLDYEMCIRDRSWANGFTNKKSPRNKQAYLLSGWQNSMPLAWYGRKIPGKKGIFGPSNIMRNLGI